MRVTTLIFHLIPIPVSNDNLFVESDKFARNPFGGICPR
jgi:hypothetical protein